MDLTQATNVGNYPCVVLVVFSSCSRAPAGRQSRVLIPSFPGFWPRSPMQRRAKKEGGLLVGWLCRTWYSLFHRHQRDNATPAISIPATDSNETPRSSQIKEALSGIRLTRIRAKDSIRNGKPNHATHHLQDQMYYIIQLEAMLPEEGEI